MPNRLANESSPYLLQHQDNPVDWYPWGEEAFSVARATGKPIFVSIGYAACHWCHVMAHESFEEAEVAALMNELFVNVKVDREERPEVDAVYMNAIHIMGEGGGWPLSAFCDSDGKPFYLGTYFPPEDKYGRPSFSSVLKTMAQVYAQQRDKVDENTAAVLDGLKRIEEHHRRLAVSGDVGRLDTELLIAAARKLVQGTDPKNGGFGSKPKFPSSSAQSFLGRASRLAFGEPAREAFLLQCRKMARGGIYDHIGGGFARYSVDERWLVPHFEKMLYDNGQLLEVYADAVAMLGGDEELKGTIEQTVSYLEREMSDSFGGLYASQDADSEGEEGKFYVWTPEEIDEVLGVADAIQFKRAYGVTAESNFENGTTVLERVGEHGDRFEEDSLRAMRERLFVARKERVAPDTDTKVLASWNGLAVAGLVRVWEVSGNETALQLATRVAGFLEENMIDDGGRRISRVFRDGVTKLEGTLDDYAFVAHGLMRLAEATGDRRWWDIAATLMTTVKERFYSLVDGVGVFYMTPSDASDRLVHRPESHQDGAIPSGAAVAVECLIRLGLVCDDREAWDIAENYVAGRAPQGIEHPYGVSRILSAADLLVHGSVVVVSEGEGRGELAGAIRRGYFPTAILAGPWAAESISSGKEAIGGGAMAFVCRQQTCSAPVGDCEQLIELLKQ